MHGKYSIWQTIYGKWLGNCLGVGGHHFAQLPTILGLIKRDVIDTYKMIKSHGGFCNTGRSCLIQYFIACFAIELSTGTLL